MVPDSDLHGNALQSLPSTSFSGLTLLTSLYVTFPDTSPATNV